MKCPNLGPDTGISPRARGLYVRALCMNLCYMCSVSKTSLCPLLLLSSWYCYSLTSSKARVCTNTNCYAPPYPPVSIHIFILSPEVGESDNNIT